MNFLFPTFLFGLAAIAIPVIIHLFNFRRYKKVYFTNVRFLKELKQESDSKSRLKEYLILAMRILAVAFLVLAFAQPFIPGKAKVQQGQKAVSIYVDNSFSMESTNKQGTLLENARNAATEIINSFGAGDRFQLITNDFEGRHQRLLSKEEFLEQLDGVKISPATRNLNDVLKRQQDFLQNSGSRNKRIFLLSDFQKNNAMIQKAGLDTAIAITLVPLIASAQNNVYIDSVWFETPVQQFGTQQIIHARVRNRSDQDIANGSVKLSVNGKQVALGAFNAAAAGQADVAIAFTVRDQGINQGVLRIEDYPITYDDEFFFSFNAQTVIRALVVNGKESRTAGNFRSLMQADSLFLYHENAETAIDYSLFPGLNVIVLNELGSLSSGLGSELQKFVNGGGSLVIFPARKADLKSYNEVFPLLQLPAISGFDTVATRTQAINFDQGLYEGVFEKADQRMDLPKVKEHFRFAQSTRSGARNILLLQNGNPLLSQYSSGSGKVYLFATPSDELSSNLIRHALFVPTLIRISVLSLRPEAPYYQTATNEAIALPNQPNLAESPLHIMNSAKTVDVIPEHRLVNNTLTLFTQNQVSEAGHYTVGLKDAVIKGLAFNYDRRESDMNFYDPAALQQLIDASGARNISVVDAGGANLTRALQEVSDGKKLWKLCLILALAFLAAEILIIRLWK